MTSLIYISCIVMYPGKLVATSCIVFYNMIFVTRNGCNKLIDHMFLVTPSRERSDLTLVLLDVCCGPLQKFFFFKNFIRFQKFPNAFQAILSSCNFWCPHPPPPPPENEITPYLTLHLTNFVYLNQFIYSSTYLNQSYG